MEVGTHRGHLRIMKRTVIPSKIKNIPHIFNMGLVGDVREQKRSEADTYIELFALANAPCLKDVQ